MKKRLSDFSEKHHFLYGLLKNVCLIILGWAVCYYLPSRPIESSNAPQKELSCILNYSRSMVSTSISDSKLQILYDGQAVDDPYIYDFTIRNSGNTVITNEDFKENFVIELRGCGKILSAQIRDASNKSVIDEVLSKASVEGEKSIMTDFFLNPQESFSVTIITDHRADGITYHSRIAGISDLTLKNTPKENHDRIIKGMGLFVAISIVAVVALIATAYIDDKRIKKKIQEEIKRYQKEDSSKEVSKSC